MILGGSRRPDRPVSGATCAAIFQRYGVLDSIAVGIRAKPPARHFVGDEENVDALRANVVGVLLPCGAYRGQMWVGSVIGRFAELESVKATSAEDPDLVQAEANGNTNKTMQITGEEASASSHVPCSAARGSRSGEVRFHCQPK